MPLSRSPAVWLLLFLAAAACTGTQDASDDRAGTDDRPAELIEAATHLADLPGRLAVLGIEDEVFLIDPDGSDRVEVAAADPSIVERSQPTWSPDGSSIAFTERSDDLEIRLIVAGAAGVIESETVVPFQAGYIAWSPTGDLVAVMGNDNDGALRLALVEPGESWQNLANGVPLYLDWQPDGAAVLINVDGRLLLTDLDGRSIDVETDGEFRVPIHIDDGLLYGVDAGVGDVLVFNDRSGSRPKGLLRFAPPAAYVAAPGGERIAVLARGARESAAVVEFDDPLLSTLAPSRLEIMDVSDGRLTTVGEGPVIAWFWSPDGRLLMFSESVVEAGEVLVRWSTYRFAQEGANGAEIVAYTPFRPSGEYARGYLAFFDQLARSVTFWSPDSEAFTYAGGLPPLDTVEVAFTGAGFGTDDNPGTDDELETEADGPLSGIWVQRLGEFEPVRITDGQVAVWSPR